MKKQILTLLTIAILGFANNDIQAANKHKKSTNSTDINYEDSDSLYTFLVIMLLKGLAEMKTDKAIKELKDDCSQDNENPKEYKQKLKNLLQKHASEFTAQEIKQLKKVVRKL